MKKADGILSKAEIILVLMMLGVTPLLFTRWMTYNFHTPKHLFFQLAVFTLTGILLFRKEITLRLNSLDYLVMLRFLWMIPLSLVTERYSRLFDKGDLFLYLILFYFAVQTVLSKRKTDEIFAFIKQGTKVLSVLCFLLSLYGLLQYAGWDIFHPGGYPSYESKVSGTFGSANSMGCFLALLVPFLLYQLKSSPSKHITAFTVITLLLTLTALILTLSRGAWTSLLGGLSFLYFPGIFQHLKKKIPRRWIKAVLICLMVVLILLFSAGSFFLNTDSAMGRLFIWKISGLMIADHPLAGIGYGNYGTRYLQYQQQFFDNPENAVYYDKACHIRLAHSEFVHITAENGIIGLILFAGLILLFWFMSAKINRKPDTPDKKLLIRIIQASFLIITLHATVDSVLRTLPISMMFYFELALISLLYHKYMGKRSALVLHPGKKIRAIMRLTGIFLIVWTLGHVIWTGTGYVYWKKGQVAVLNHRWQEGIDYYEKAILYLPDKGELRFHLGAAYAYTGETLKAIDYIEGSRDNFNDKNMYLVLGQSYMQTENYTRAEDHLITVTEMFPQLLYPHLLLAELYHKTGYLSKAISELRFILESEPKIISDDVMTIKQNALQYLNLLLEE